MEILHSLHAWPNCQAWFATAYCIKMSVVCKEELLLIIYFPSLLVVFFTWARILSLNSRSIFFPALMNHYQNCQDIRCTTVSWILWKVNWNLVATPIRNLLHSYSLILQLYLLLETLDLVIFLNCSIPSILLHQDLRLNLYCADFGLPTFLLLHMRINCRK